MILQLCLILLCSGQLSVYLRKKQTSASTSTQLTQEELDILYEEPEMMTTNALKAIYGFVPQDEKHICKFYDAVTGRCFKGNSCKLEHVPILNGKCVYKFQ